MKILHLLASPFFTGPAEAVVQLALAQRALGHQVEVAVDRKRTAHTSEELLVPRLLPTGLLSSLALELSVKSTPWALWRDGRTLSGVHVDVVHSHFSHDATLARWALPRHVTLIRSLHAQRSVRRWLPRAHGYTVPVAAWSRALLGKPVLVLPPLVGSEFVPASERIELRRKLNLPGGRLVGMVSTFQPSRRHRLGLDAFAMVRQRAPDASFIVVGDGPLESELKRHAGEGVHFVGYQSGQQFVQYLQALDEVWILGLGNDWSARAAAQARQCGVRVVAVDEGALSQFADAVVEPTAAAVAQAALSESTRRVSVESPDDIARRVLAFYEAAAP